jgi:hypothetical protein
MSREPVAGHGRATSLSSGRDRGRTYHPSTAPPGGLRARSAMRCTVTNTVLFEKRSRGKTHILLLRQLVRLVEYNEVFSLQRRALGSSHKVRENGVLCVDLVRVCLGNPQLCSEAA